MSSFPEHAVRFPALAGHIVLYSWASHSTLTVPLSDQEYKWIRANCWGNITNCEEVTCDGLTSRPEAVGILLTPSCYKNRDKLSLSQLAPRLNLFFFLTKALLLRACNRWTAFLFHHCRNRKFSMLRHAFLHTFKDVFIFIYLFLTKSFIRFKFGAVKEPKLWNSNQWVLFY